MKSNLTKYLALGLILLTIIAVVACAKPPTTPPTPTPPTPPPSPETPKPAKFAVNELTISPDIVMPSDEVTVTATIANTGGTKGDYTAILTLDEQELEKKNVLIDPGTTMTATFKLISPGTSGSYTLSVGEANVNLEVSSWVAHTIQYADVDNKNIWKILTAPGRYGLLSHFEIPGSFFRIKSINIYGGIKGLVIAGLGERSFTLRIWDNKLSQELYSADYPYNLFATEYLLDWVEVQVPDVRVDGDFYVEVLPNAEMTPDENEVKCGLYIALDWSAPEGNADVTFNGVKQSWILDWGEKEHSAWAIRIEGESGP